MGDLLSYLIPMALASGVSPMMFSEQMLVLSGSGGRWAALRYLAGTATIVLVVVGLVLTIGRTVSLPSAPRLSAGLDLALGALLVVIALLVRVRGDRRPRHPKAAGQSHHRHHAAYAFGLFSMATNFTTLPLVVAASKNVASSGVGPAGIAVGVVVVVVGACLPAWLPLLIDRLPGARRAVEDLSHFVDTHGRTLLVLALAGIGLFLIVKGIVESPW